MSNNDFRIKRYTDTGTGNNSKKSSDTNTNSNANPLKVSVPVIDNLKTDTQTKTQETKGPSAEKIAQVKENVARMKLKNSSNTDTSNQTSDTSATNESNNANNTNKANNTTDTSNSNGLIAPYTKEELASRGDLTPREYTAKLKSQEYYEQLNDRLNTYESHKANNADYDLDLVQYSDDDGNTILGSEYRKRYNDLAEKSKSLIDAYNATGDELAYTKGYQSLSQEIADLEKYSNSDYSSSTLNSKIEENKAKIKELSSQLSTGNYVNTQTGVYRADSQNVLNKNTLSDEERSSISKQISELNSENEQLQTKLDDIDTLKESGTWQQVMSSGDEKAIANLKEETSHYNDNILERALSMTESAVYGIANTFVNLASLRGQALMQQTGAVESGLVNIVQDVSNGKALTVDQYNNVMDTANAMMSVDSTNWEYRKECDETLAKLNSYVTAGVDDPAQKFALEGLNSSSNFLIQFALLGPTGSLATMSAQSGTSRYYELKQQTDDNGNPLYSDAQCLANGALTGLMSYATEKIGMDAFVDAMTGGVGKYLSGHAIEYIGKSALNSALSEGSEEVAEALGDLAINAVTGISNGDFSVDDLMYSFALGAFSGGLSGAVGGLTYVCRTNENYNALKEFKAELNELAPMATSEELARINYEIAKVDDALNAFTSQSVTAGAVEMQSQQSEGTTNQQALVTLSEALAPNINENANLTNQLNNLSNQVNTVTQALLLQNGVNMDIDQFESLDGESRQTVMTLSEYAKQLGLDVVFDTNLNNVNVNGQGVNGLNYNGQIVINPLSKTAQSAILGHEITHLFEGNSKYNKFVDMIKETSDYKGIENSTIAQYKDVAPQFLEEESVAKYVENKLADTDFIKKLVSYDTNLASRIFQDISSMVDFSENREKHRLQNAWQRAFREYKANGSSNRVYVDMAYALQSDEKNKELAKNAYNENGLKPLETQFEEMSKDNNFGLASFDVGDNLNFAGIENSKLFLSKQNLKHLTTRQDYKTVANVLENIKNEVVLATDYLDKNGSSKKAVIVEHNRTPYLVSIMPDLNINGLVVDEVKTLIEKDNTDGSINNLKRYLEKSTEMSNRVYLNEKSNDFLARVGLPLSADSSTIAFTNNISKNSDNVNNFISTTDSTGSPISPNQQEYFKNSKVVDENGNLMRVYHGTDNNFTIFDDSKGRLNMDIQGSYFSSSNEYAKDYGKNVGSYYLNIKNPASQEIAYQAFDMFKGQNEVGAKAKEFLISQGYDGIISNDENNVSEYVTFYPEQIKNVENYNPTRNHDTRYSLSDNTQGGNSTFNQPVSEQEQTPEQEIQAKYQQNISEYGAFKKGGEPRVNRKVPKATEKGPNSEFARNLAESQQLNDNNLADFKKAINDGEFSYTKITNKGLYDDATKKLDRVGVDALYDEVMNSRQYSPKLIAEESVLMSSLSQANDNERLMKLGSKMANDATEISQTLQSFNIFKRLTPEGQYQSVIEMRDRMQRSVNERWGNRAPDLEIPQNLVDDLRNARSDEDFANVRKAIQDSLIDQVPNTMWEKVDAWRYLAMLGNPTTHVRNILGNAVFSPMVDLKDAIGAIIESQAEKAGKLERRTKTLYNPFSKEWREAKKRGKEAYDSIKVMMEGSDSKYEHGPLKGPVGWINEKTSKFLDKEDWIAAKGRFAKAYAQYILSNHIDADNFSNEDKSIAQQHSLLEAQRATYRDFNATAQFLNQLEKKNNGMAVLSFVKKGIMPFTTTPLNIIRRGYEYSPVGLAVGLITETKKLKEGRIDANQYIDRISCGLSGTAVFAIGALLAALGLFRTSDDDSDRKQQFDEDNGEQDYSIILPNGATYTLDWLSPSIIPMAMGAEVYNFIDDLQTGKLDETDTMEKVLEIGSKLADPMTETTMLSNLSSALSSYESDSSKRFGTLLGKVMQSYATQMVPTVFGKIARVVDDTKRTTYPNSGTIDSTIKQILNKTPGASTLLEPSVDLSGNEVKNTGGSFMGRLIYNMVSPGYYKANTIDEYDQEYYRLYESTGSLDVFPSSKKTYVNYDGEKYDFSDSDYTEWNKTRWAKEKELVDEFIDSESYAYYTDEERVKTIKQLREYAGDVAKEEFLASKGITLEDTAYEKVKGATENDVSVADYYNTKNYYSGLSGDDKKSDYIDYLKDTNLSSEAKEYMYKMEYGDSKSYGYVQDLDLDSDKKFQIYEIIADTKADKDDDGNTISNSKANKVKEQYEQLGVYDQIVEYVNSHDDVEYSSFGLTKSVVNGTSKSSKKSSKSSSSSKTSSKASSSESGLSGTVDMAGSKTAKLTTQNSSGTTSNKSTSSNSSSSNNNINLRNFTGANTVLNSNAKGTISQASESVLDDEWKDAYYKIFRNSLA